MGYRYNALVVAAVGISLFALAAFAQDQSSQSLGDVARQTRQQKQQKDAHSDKDAQAAAKDTSANDGQNSNSKDANTTAQPSKPAKKVITNDEIPEHVGPTSTNPNSNRQPNVTYPQPNYAGNSAAAGEQWKNQILGVKSYIASMQTQISNLEQSIRYTGGNCVSGCVQWNERQQQKQQQVEAMKQQLEEQLKHLEEMQEMARRQGFGSSVYDP